MEESILEAASSLIHQYGFRKFTMDDLSQKLGISKKTLYKHYPGKRQLISAVNDHFIARDLEYTQKVMEQDESWLNKIKDIVFVSQYAIPARLVSELRYYYPAEWKKAEALRKFKSEQIYALLREGERQGELNTALELSIVVPILEKMLESFLQVDYLQAYDLTISRLLEQLSELLLNGLVKR